jgi:hypothetical protein
MVKALIISLIFLFEGAYAWSQSSSDTTRNEEVPECEIVAYNSTRLIMMYYDNQEFDSALLVLNDWQTACGISEPVVRTRILLAISDNAFDEDIYDSTYVDDALNYIQRMESKTPVEFYNNYKSYFGYVPIRGEYDYFMQSLADTLLSRGFDTPLELLLCQFYANIVVNPFAVIQTDTIYNSTEIKKYYYHRAEKCFSGMETNFNFFTGAWIPTGNASMLGVHPLIGIQGGVKMNKTTFNLTLAFKFINSPNKYVILKDGVNDTTSHFFGGYIGADIEREIYKGRKNEFNLLAGFGYDGFESIKPENTNNDSYSGHSISSLNTNFGIGYRYFYNKHSYIGLQAKYNIVNYNNKGGTNLMGDCFTITISVGGFVNTAKENCLYELRYTE